jgi:hypothetical protein
MYATATYRCSELSGAIALAEVVIIDEIIFHRYDSDYWDMTDVCSMLYTNVIAHDLSNIIAHTKCTKYYRGIWAPPIMNGRLNSIHQVYSIKREHSRFIVHRLDGRWSGLADYVRERLW